jgi:aryl-alcohol dehydrogenase-like predicted oxidoreductase
MPRRAILHRAFDLGVTHFDLANNYGATLVVLSRKVWLSARRADDVGFIWSRLERSTATLAPLTKERQ